MSASKRRDIPRFEHPIIETHCHLDYLDEAELEETLARAADVGVERIITIAVSPDNLGTVTALADRYPSVWCTQGVHPHEAESFDEATADRILASPGQPRVVAVGEIGLDYYYDHADRAVQRKVFARQLEIAAQLELPVVIHSRDADDDMRAILQEHMAQLPRRGVIHSFSSGMELAEFSIDAGFALGFNGMVTFRNADNVRDAVAATPLKQLLLETDAPYLTPVPYRGRQNAPCFLPFIAERIADIKDVPVEALLQQAHHNSLQLFFSSEVGA